MSTARSRPGENGHGPRVAQRRTRAALARQLRESGAEVPEIAAVLGCTRSTIYSYLADPPNDRNRRLKLTYRGECEECGAPTSGGDGAARGRRYCRRCSSKRRTLWTRTTVIAALTDWSLRFGDGRPPSSYELERSVRLPASTEHAAVAARYPSPRTCRRLFGGYPAAMAALHAAQAQRSDD